MKDEPQLNCPPISRMKLGWERVASPPKCRLSVRVASSGLVLSGDVCTAVERSPWQHLRRKMLLYVWLVFSPAVGMMGTKTCKTFTFIHNKLPWVVIALAVKLHTLQCTHSMYEWQIHPMSYSPNGVVVAALENCGWSVGAETKSFMTDVITVHIKAKYGRVPFLDSLVILSLRTIQTHSLANKMDGKLHGDVAISQCQNQEKPGATFITHWLTVDGISVVHGSTIVDNPQERGCN